MPAYPGMNSEAVTVSKNPTVAPAALSNRRFILFVLLTESLGSGLRFVRLDPGGQDEAAVFRGSPDNRERFKQVPRLRLQQNCRRSIGGER